MFGQRQQTRKNDIIDDKFDIIEIEKEKKMILIR